MNGREAMDLLTAVVRSTPRSSMRESGRVINPIGFRLQLRNHDKKSIQEKKEKSGGDPIFSCSTVEHVFHSSLHKKQSKETWSRSASILSTIQED